MYQAGVFNQVLTLKVFIIMEPYHGITKKVETFLK